ncbi:transposable element Tcb1 transposase [Trichonephila clavipes]|nr:transposable element Tcb1 transposase [Trichonephila clavipes]
MWVADWNEVFFTDESRICLQHHDGRIRVWRHRGERMLNRCVMYHHTGPATGIMVWGGIGYHSRTPLVCIAGTLNSQRYISEVLKPVVLPYLQGCLYSGETPEFSGDFELRYPEIPGIVVQKEVEIIMNYLF